MITLSILIVLALICGRSNTLRARDIQIKDIDAAIKNLL